MVVCELNKKEYFRVFVGMSECMCVCVCSWEK